MGSKQSRTIWAWTIGRLSSRVLINLNNWIPIWEDILEAYLEGCCGSMDAYMGAYFGRPFEA